MDPILYNVIYSLLSDATTPALGRVQALMLGRLSVVAGRGGGWGWFGRMGVGGRVLCCPVRGFPDSDL